MLLFKTSSDTFESVIRNQCHASFGIPNEWHPGELVIVSKNKKDCGENEKQVQYTMRLVDIRPITGEEIDLYWPGSTGRWRYLVVCNDTRKIEHPFDLKDILGKEAARYNPVMTFCKIDAGHEELLMARLPV